MSTLKKYRVDLGWSANELARQAHITRPAVSQAEKGLPVQAATAKAIADALSRGTKKTVNPSDIEGLNIL
jgi:transcriptional regulator with XRE-family HTH domain